MPTIAGNVTRKGSALGGAYVRLIGPSGEFTAEEYTKDDGKFLFHVVEGSWRLEVRAPGAGTTAQSVEVRDADEEVSIEVEEAAAR